MAASSNAEDWKLWPPPVEKHVIDVLVEEEAKGNMPSGQFKKGLSTVVQNKFNQRAKKAYHKEQLCQKYEKLKQRHSVFSQLIGWTEMGWDFVTNMVTSSDVAWAQVLAVSYKFTL